MRLVNNFGKCRFCGHCAVGHGFQPTLSSAEISLNRAPYFCPARAAGLLGTARRAFWNSKRRKIGGSRTAQHADERRCPVIHFSAKWLYAANYRTEGVLRELGTYPRCRRMAATMGYMLPKRANAVYDRRTLLELVRMLAVDREDQIGKEIGRAHV